MSDQQPQTDPFEDQVLDLLGKVVDSQNAQADSLNELNKRFARLRDPFAEMDRRMTTLEDIARMAVEDGRQARENTHQIRNLMVGVVDCLNECVRSLHKIAESAKGSASASSDRLQALVAKVNQSADKVR